MSKFIDLTGKVFGRLRVLERDKGANSKQVTWMCICDCGQKTAVLGYHLRSGHTQSCGCLCKERISEIKKTHGLRKSPIYAVWANMKNRCLNPNVRAYKDYGARGIAVCREWLTDFQAFHDWCLANGYKRGLEIDRIDNDGGYRPGNCRFVTPQKNGRNKRNNRLFEFNGKVRSLAEWAEYIQVPYNTLQTRVNLGWSIAKALTAPVRQRKQVS